jgi:hypothetical protein
MTTMDIASRPLSEADQRAQLRRAVIASTVGTTIEWYDFFLYSQAAALVFGKLFFPRSDPLVGVMEAFAVFFVGYVTRPIGAAIFGLAPTGWRSDWVKQRKQAAWPNSRGGEETKWAPKSRDRNHLSQSGRHDLNVRPPAPKAGALPS